jgi:DNA mismatch repair protein MLH3
VLVDRLPCICGVPLTVDSLREYLRLLGDTAGAGGPPPHVDRVLASKACRSAVMFGDALGPAECEALLVRLAACAVPFQCAHGRPSLFPLADMRALPVGSSKAPALLPVVEAAVVGRKRALPGLAALRKRVQM